MRLLYKRRKIISLFFITVLVIQIIQAPVAYALTGGPSQPEVQSFEPATTTEMVDLFSGDFVYNIPLFELPGPNGGYPFNLAYHAGITMDQESSWCGLGWNLSPGSINRQMRGLPDEFNGDLVYTKLSVEPSVTVGLGVGVGLEPFGADKTLGSATFGLGVTNNNYKGLSYSIDASLGFNLAANSGMTSSLGLNVSLDSREGANIQPSLGLGNSLTFNAAYNSKAGLQNVSYQVNLGTMKTKGAESGSQSLGASSTLSLSHSGYTPQISMPMRNVNISAKIKVGGSWWGLFGSGYLRGFYNEQWLRNDKKRVPARAYGYLNYQHANSPDALLDVNREKDGIVIQESPNLAIPSLTYDIYSVTGQGISAMYRPMRNDYGVAHDSEVFSESEGGAVGVDVGPAASHFGANLNIMHSRSVSGLWRAGNQMVNHSPFLSKITDDPYEPWYFKVHGEPSAESVSKLEALGGTSPVRVGLNVSRDRGLDILDFGASTTLQGRGWSQNLPDSLSYRERQSRNQSIQTITNEQLLKNGEELVSLFKIKYIDHAGATQTFSRTDLPVHHIAGFTALTPGGLRYNYGIPAYNLLQEEVTFSSRPPSSDSTRVDVGNSGNGDPSFGHPGTDKFLRKTEIPKYPHAYLLTSIVGPDYVDVSGNGVTEDDLGYWVKFTYKKTTTDSDRYKWRDPYSQAHYLEGWKTDSRDDKGSFVYGEKEMWYLAQVETKSHIATFVLETRDDGRGVAAKLQDANNRGKAVFALKEIRLFTRSAGSTFPIKVVRLDYDYSLCDGIFNSSTGGGKLTLRKLWFEYGNSERGKLNPYEFSYHQGPNYNPHAYDRWGNYKPYPADNPHYNIDFPYVEQDPLKKQDIDTQVASWNLREVKLPSGSRVVIDYETDDYGYVQHLPAMQMTKIADPYALPSAAAASDAFELTENTKIRFKLETPIDGTLTPEQQQQEVLKYLDRRTKQLYFKARINLKKPGSGLYEYISGYADIDFSPSTMGLEKDNSGKYVWGYFQVLPEEGRHPFSMRAWQHLRTNQPDLANSLRTKVKQTGNNGQRVAQIKSLASGDLFTQVRQMFTGFYKFCYNHNWGRQVDATRAWIRLNSPDKIKYGGGLRVRQITMYDNWQGDEEGIYGQVYEYTMEEKGITISSGVAAYEPIIGGEENPLRYAKKYVQAVPLRSDNNLFFEYPVNESHYPGPQVGYRKVTVSSLAAASLAGKEVKNITGSDNRKLFPEGGNKTYGTTGVVVHEFYTAKDFPVLTDETDKTNLPFRVSVPIPLLGQLSVHHLAASQGYSIITNDMHGKQRQVSNYRQDKTGRLEPEPISWVKYNYLTEERFYQQEKVLSLSNTLKDNGDGTLSIPSQQDITNNAVQKYFLGQETDFFMDMREFDDKTWEGGAALNVDVLFFFFPMFAPTVWPSVGRSSTQLRTAVTNKVIFRSGILQSTEAYDQGSHVKTENLKWDKRTGATVLTRVNNNFDAPIYSYSIPAYTQYEGMGAAYENVGLTFTVNDVQQNMYETTLYSFTSPSAYRLFPGDEIILYSTGENPGVPVAHVIYTGEENGVRLLSSEETTLSDASYKGMIVRSGFRNQLSVMAGSITALEDPTQPGTVSTFGQVIKIPD